MSKSGLRVLDVGNCDPDHTAMRRLLSQFDVAVDRVMFVDEAMSALQVTRYHLVLVNRLIFADASDALPLIERMHADEAIGDIPVMMISNHADAQDRAMAAGAVRGFGKADLDMASTVDLLRPYLK